MYRGPGKGASDVQVNQTGKKSLRMVSSADLDWLFKLTKGAEPPREDSVS